MKRKKILIVSVHFPPLNTMASKRYGYMCKYFEENGYEPYILTARARGGGYLNAGLDMPIPLEDRRIVCIGDLGITYPITNFVWNWIVYKYKFQNINSRIIEEESLGWYEKVKKELDIQQFSDVDIVLGTFPSIGNLLAARYIAKRIRRPFVAEIRDLMSDYEEGCNRSRFVKSWEVQVEKEILKKSAGIVTVTKGFKKTLKERYPNKNVITIYNGWEDKEIQKHQEDGGYLYYAGSLYEHRVESLKLLFQVIKQREIDCKVKIRSVGPEILDDKLRKYVFEMGLQEKIEILNAAPEDVVRKEQDGARINLLVSSLDANDKALMTTIPGKLFELIALNSPVLAIVDESAEIAEILHDTEKGKALSVPDDIFSFITKDYVKYRGIKEKVNGYSRKNQAKKLCEFFDGISRRIR